MKPQFKSATYIGLIFVYLLGSASLFLLLVFLYLGSFHFFRFNLGATVALVWNALLCLAFFLQHSGMVRRSFRHRFERIVPEAFYGLVYTVASGFVLVLCLVLWQRTSVTVVRLEGAFVWFCRALFILSIVGFAWGARIFGSFDAFGVRAAIAHMRGTRSRQHSFVMKGPYRWVRHPFYFFALVLIWSCPVITSDRLLFNILWTIWIVVGTILEERDLISHFGDVYVRYQQQVPMIIPWRGPAHRSPGSNNHR